MRSANDGSPLNEKVFQQTGKLMEKYNVEDMDIHRQGEANMKDRMVLDGPMASYVALKHQRVDFGPASLPVDY
jgi:hypothetical protein